MLLKFAKRTSCLITVILIIVFNKGNAQYWGSPMQHGNATYNNVVMKATFFISSTQGWAVGSNGTIITTTNGGSTWSAQNSGSLQQLNAVYFTSPNQGFVVGNAGVILTTSNGGVTWIAQSSSTSNALNGVYFISSTKGWAVGNAGTILTTNNGGTTWGLQTSNTGNILYAITFVNNTRGWAVGNAGTILTTNNGGTTWSAQTSGTTNPLYSISFTSSTQGWVTGNAGTILTTSNTGTTWTAQTSGTTNALNGVYFTSAMQGCAVGANGSIYTTINGGATWTSQNSGSGNILYGVHFVSSTHGWAIGIGGTIVTTSNGGNTWNPQAYGIVQQLNCVFFSSATEGCTVGAGGTILTTSNGGSTWTIRNSGVTSTLNSVYFVSASQGWAVGALGTILSTNNGGISWTSQTSGTTIALTSVYFTSATQGWAVGNTGVILKTNNGGTTWTAQTSGTTNSLTAVNFSSSTQGWAVGSNGIILKTTNGGDNWVLQTLGTSTFNAIHFTSINEGCIVGNAGTIYSTSNAGNNWTLRSSGTSNSLNSVYFTSATQGWAAGNAGTILTTSNAGVTWVAQPSNTTNNLRSTFFTSNTQGFAVGSSGNILIYTSDCTPIVYSLTSLGANCVGGNGVSIGLSSSQVGINYQLYFNGSTPIGNIIPGNGNAISFGNNFTTIGTYTAVGTNTNGNCSASMTGSIQVTLNNPPTITNISPGNFCLHADSIQLITTNTNQVQWQNNGNTISTGNVFNTIAFSAATTVAGGNGFGSSANQLYLPTDVFVDKQNNVYVSDYTNHRIQKWAVGSTSGETVAGGNGIGSANNQLNAPTGVFVDVAGNIYVCDYNNHRIQKWAVGANTGITVAGGNGPGSGSNQLNSPVAVFVDATGSVYVADALNYRIQKWAQGANSGTTVAGGGGPGPNAFYPAGLHVDATNNIYICDQINHSVLKWVPGASSGTVVAGGNGQGNAANQLNTPFGIYVDPSNNVYISDQYNHRVQKWAPGADTGTTIIGGNGPGAGSNQLEYPTSVYLDSTGSAFICDYGNHRIQKLIASQKFIFKPTTDGLYTANVINSNGCSLISTSVLVHSLPVVTASATYSTSCPASTVLDTLTGNGANAYIWSGGVINGVGFIPNLGTSYTVTGTDANGCSNTSSITIASSIPTLESISPSSFCLDTDSITLYTPQLGDVQWQHNGTTLSTHSLSSVTTARTVAGGILQGGSANKLWNPHGLFVDANNNIYICDANNFRIQKWAPSASTGVTVAGGNGYGFSANQFTTAWDVFVDTAGNVYVCDGVSSRIQKWAPGASFGITVAGGNGSGSAANQLNNPTGIYIDGSGNMYIADNGNNRVQKWAPGAIAGITVAGGNGAGSASNQLLNPWDVFLDANGSMYISEVGNHRVQKWVPGATSGITVAGGNGQGDNANQLNTPYNVFVDSGGSVFVADFYNNRVQKWVIGSSSGTTVAGGNGQGSNANQLNNPTGIWVNSAGYIFVSEYANPRVQKWALHKDYFKPTVAGNYTAILTTSPGCSLVSSTVIVKQPSTPSTVSLSFCNSGFLPNNTLVTSTGIYPVIYSNAMGCDSLVSYNVTIFPLPVVSISASSTNFCVGNTLPVTLTGVGALSYTWSGGINNGVAFIPTNTATYTVTGTDVNGCTSSSAVLLSLNQPTINSITPNSLCLGSDSIKLNASANTTNVEWLLNGNTLSSNFIPPSYSLAGTIVAGGNGQGSALNQFNSPSGIALDALGNRYISDKINHRIIKWIPGASVGIIVAGGNGQGNGANQLDNPTGVFVDAFGNIFVCDGGNHRVQKWSVGNTSGITVAGGNGQGNSANQLSNPVGLFVDALGSVYVCDRQNNRIQKWVSGAITGTTVAGGGYGASPNTLTYPNGVFVDVNGNVFISDQGNNRIQKWAVGATAGTTVAGSASGSGGSAANKLSGPSGVWVDSSGNLFICDQYNARVQKWAVGATTGVTVAGGNNFGSGNNQFNSIVGLCLDNDGNILLCDEGNQDIRKWNVVKQTYLKPTVPGIYSAIVTSNTGCSATSTIVNVKQPSTPINVYVTFCGSGFLPNSNTNIITNSGTYPITYTNVMGCDSLVTYIVTITPNPVIVTAGATYTNFCLGSTAINVLKGYGAATYTWSGGVTDGVGFVPTATATYTVTGTDANGCSNTSSITLSLISPPVINSITSSSLCANSDSLILNTSPEVTQVAWHYNGTLVNTYSSLTTLISSTGNTIVSGSVGSGASQFNGMESIVVDKMGNIYVCDGSNHRVQKWTPGATTGITVAGGNGQGTAANQLKYPNGIFIDGLGNLYISDNLNHRVQKWAFGATSGVTVAGGNGQGSAANQLNSPKGVFVDKFNNIYVSDQNNNRVQKWLAGATSGITVATANNPKGIFVDSVNTLYVIDFSNNRIQKWPSGSSTGITVAGGNGNGNAANQLSYPNGLWVDKAGSIYVNDFNNSRIQKWPVGAYSGITVAGGNGSGSAANQLSYPTSVFVDSVGNIYIADNGNTCVQKWAASNSAKFMPTSEGIYSAVASNSTGCSSTSIQIAILDNPLVNITSSFTNFCIGSAAVDTLTASNGNSSAIFSWTGGINNGVGFTPTSTATYTVTASNANGCSISNEITIKANPVPIITNITPNSLCLGSDSISITATDATQIQWLKNGNVVNTSNNFNSTPATFGVTVAGGNGQGSASNQLNVPMTIYVDTAENIYITDYAEHRVQKWPKGSAIGITVAGGNGQGNGANQLNNPWGLFVDSTQTIYVTEGNKVKKFTKGNSNGILVAGGNGSGNGANQLNGATSIFKDGIGSLFICDGNNHRIQKWPLGALSGITVAGTGIGGMSANQFYNPVFAAVDNVGSIYVSDPGFFNSSNRVQKWLQGSTSGITLVGGMSGNAANQISNPSGLFVDSAHNLFICDLYNHRIQKWAEGATTGITVAGGNGNGSAANQLLSPNSVFVDKKGNVFVLDRGNYRVQKWSPLKKTSYVPNDAGTYTAIITNSEGCSVTSNDILVKDNYTVIATAGSNGSITPNGNTMLCSGSSITYSIAPDSGYIIHDVLVDGNSIGANSNYTFTNITQPHSIYASFISCVNTSSVNQNICEGSSYNFNGTDLSAAGVYTDTLINVYGCDSIVTLNLFVIENTSHIDTVVACDTFTWLVNGNTYSNSGEYFVTSTNPSGCMHTELLKLTINEGTNHTNYIIACDSFTWIVNGITYAASGIYTTTNTNTSGCAHTEILDLTINNSTSSVNNITACNNYTWSADSITYTTSGVYSFSSINSAGCLNSEILNLTILPLPIVTAMNVSSCPGNSVILSGQPSGGSFSLPNPYLGNATIYTYFFTDTNGCSNSAVATLNTTTASIFDIDVTNITGISATVIYNSVSGIGWYEIRYKPISSSIWITTTNNTTIKNLIDLIPNTVYNLEIRGFCSLTNVGPWASTTFTTNNLCGTPTGLYVTNIGNTTAKLNWTGVAGANFYTVKWKKITALNWISATSTQTSKSIAGLSTGQYEFQVKTNCGNSSSPFSSSIYFTINSGLKETDVSKDTLTSTINIFPNPTFNLLNIELNTKEKNMITVKVLDISGRVIKQLQQQAEVGFNHIQLELYPLSKGLYTLHIFENEKLSYTQKISKF